MMFCLHSRRTAAFANVHVVVAVDTVFPPDPGGPPKLLLGEVGPMLFMRFIIPLAASASVPAVEAGV